MNSKDKKNKKRYRFLFLLSLLTILGLLFIIFTVDSKLEAYQESDTIPASTHQDLKKDLEDYIAVSAADEQWMLKKQPQNALESYKNLDLSNPTLRKKVDQRIERISNILKSENDDELTKINLRTELKQSLDKKDSLSIKLDSLQQSFKLTYNRLERRSDSLANELDRKDRQLEREEILKVISFETDKGILVHYIGETQNNTANGNGVGVWANGSIYKGEWKTNQPHGKGEYQWADGARYNGDFVRGERSGEGTFYYPTGEKYIGEFKNGLRDGIGTLYDIDGNVSFKGSWKKDKPKQEKP
jgi:hypothetical protein